MFFFIYTVVYLLSCVQPFVTPVAHQAPLWEEISQARILQWVARALTIGWHCSEHFTDINVSMP